MISLYEHNQVAYNEVNTFLDTYGKAAVIHPTGTGKSFIAFKLAEDHPDALFVWVSPSENIYHTQLENIEKASGFIPKNITFLTYAKLMLLTEMEIEDLKPSYIILDEFHRAGAAEWGHGVQQLLAIHPSALVLGLTATNIRYLDHQRDMAEELFDNCIADQMSLSEAIVRGILPAPKYIVSYYSFELDIKNYKNRMKRASAPVRQKAEECLEHLRRVLEKSEGLDTIFAKHMPDPHGKYIVFCANYQHMLEMQEKAAGWFGKVDPEAHIYSVWSDSASFRADYDAFKADETEHLKLLFCIDMFNEGIHVEDISGVIMFRPTVSPIIYKQQIGRALSAMKDGQPVIFDIVNNFENLYSVSALQEEIQEMVTFYRNEKREISLDAESFQIIDEVKDCRALFNQLEETLGMSWDMMYREAKKYYERYGDLEVSKSYRTEDNVPLGAWIQTQRRIYHGKRNGLLTETRISLLNRIGMVWDYRADSAWENGYEHAEAYKNEYGNLRVPIRYVSPDGYRLGAWIRRNRNTFIKEKNAGRDPLENEQLKRLDELGIIWGGSEESFERGLSEAVRYAEENGDLNVPNNYITKNGFALGKWIRRQRQRYFHFKNFSPLEENEKKSLEAIGIVWADRYEQQWEKSFGLAREYSKQNGSLKCPADCIVNGVNIGRWIVRQQNAYKSGKLSPEKIQLLESIGLTWPSRNKTWEENFALAKEYFLAHGNLEIPPSYIASNGVWLGRWISRQRKDASENRLSAEQIDLLDTIGMRWDSKYTVQWDRTYDNLVSILQESHCGELSPVQLSDAFGANINRWIRMQIKKSKEGKMSPAQQRKWDMLWKQYPSLSSPVSRAETQIG